MIDVVEATEDHIQAMLGNIRQADIDELEAGYFVSPEQALQIGLKVSSHCWAAVKDGDVICIGGVTAYGFTGDMGAPWMVGTTAIDDPKLRRDFMELSKRELAKMRGIYPNLQNWVDARNAKAIAWLKWLGFKLYPAEPWGPAGLLFHRFDLREV